MNKSLLGLIIAAIVAIIGYLIYKFFFSKDSNSTNNAAGLAGGTVAANAIKPPVVTTPESNTAEFGSIYRNGFDMNQQETLTNGTALSQRTNNPGALFWDNTTKWQGMNETLTLKNGIIYFDTFDYGVRAQLMTLKNYSKKHGIKTLNELTARYAPVGSGGHETNNPIAYANILSSYIGIGVNDTFNLDSNRELLAAIGYFIHRVEAGYFWLPRTKYNEWSTKV
ncbi:MULTISPECIES: hypothetical protein [unclassified Dysgonomonas]|uniref:hypothetical protein n=1 Tax=unclassified Dysgonomonas TaxID=2630389 RepID=UPI0025C4CCED|nr:MULTISPECIES: hypothetical protein [unclassified Dysgonomonas]